MLNGLVLQRSENRQVTGFILLIFPIDCCVRINTKPDCLFSGYSQSSDRIHFKTWVILTKPEFRLFQSRKTKTKTKNPPKFKGEASTSIYADWGNGG